MKNFNLLCTFLLCSLSGSKVVYSQTTVTSNIYSSTTWTASSSPYIIANNIVVFAGATLTIEPGVTVKFNDDISVDFRGQLIATGRATQRIIFTSSNTTPTAGIYGGFKVTGFIGTSGSIKNQITMSYCSINYAQNFMNLISSCEGPFIFHNCYFYKNHFGIGDSPDCRDLYVDSCEFDSNFLGVNQDENGEVYVTNCLFINNTTGTTANNVSNSVFTGNNLGVFAYTSLQNCEIYGNNIGAEVDVHAGTTVNHNYIHDNTIGIKLDKLAQIAIGQFTQNKICNNSQWNIQYTMNLNGDASNNCFCSTDSSYIRSKISDGYVNSTVGLLTINVDNLCKAGITEVKLLPNTESQQVRIYPNPFYDQATLEFDYSLDHHYQLVIVDQLGRSIKTVNEIYKGSVTIQRGNMAPGLYYYRIKNEQQTINSGKLMVE